MQKSIVLVTVDCLRADHVGFMGYPRPTTPFLDSLAEQSCVVPAAIVAGAPTYYSLPGILASRHPLALGRDVIGFDPEEETIASVLRENGYATAAFAAGNPYISSRFGYDRGFDVFQDFLDLGSTESSAEESSDQSKGLLSRFNRKMQAAQMGPLRIAYDELYFQYCQRVTPVEKSVESLRRFPAADAIVDRACSWLDGNAGRPIFLWLHLMDPHSPYYPKEEALALMGDRPRNPFRARYLNSYWNRSDLGAWRLGRHRDDILALYDGGIRWMDAQLGRLVQRLKQLNQWGECLFAVTADHGEEFLEHGGRYHPPSKLNEEVIRVPLLVRVPGLRKAVLPQVPFSLIDLAPSLLEGAGLDVPSSFQGRSRLARWQQAGEEDGVAVTESICCTNPFRMESRLGPRVLAVREKRFKLIVHFETWDERLYDLEADPGEQAPLAVTTQRPVRRRLLEMAHEHVKMLLENRDARARVRARVHELQLEWMRSQPQSATA